MNNIPLTIRTIYYVAFGYMATDLEVISEMYNYVTLCASHLNKPANLIEAQDVLQELANELMILGGTR